MLTCDAVMKYLLSKGFTIEDYERGIFRDRSGRKLAICSNVHYIIVYYYCVDYISSLKELEKIIQNPFFPLIQVANNIVRKNKHCYADILMHQGVISCYNLIIRSYCTDKRLLTKLAKFIYCMIISAMQFNISGRLSIKRKNIVYEIYGIGDRCHRRMICFSISKIEEKPLTDMIYEMRGRLIDISLG